MPLSAEQRERLRSAALAAGLGEDEVVKAAEAKVAGAGTNPKSADTPDTGPLAAERFLIGFLPYVTVREFREIVLGLSGEVPDSDMFTGEWLNIHGQTGGQAPPVDEGDQ